MGLLELILKEDRYTTKSARRSRLRVGAWMNASVVRRFCGFARERVMRTQSKRGREGAWLDEASPPNVSNSHREPRGTR